MIFAVDPIINPAVPGLAGKNPAEVFGEIIASIVGILLIAATIWALFQLLLGGLNWISSGGDKAHLETARNRITQALVGLLIVFSVWALYIVILQFLGIVPAGAKNVNLRLPTLFESSSAPAPTRPRR